jgi:hypothetical protein
MSIQCGNCRNLKEWLAGHSLTLLTLPSDGNLSAAQELLDLLICGLLKLLHKFNGHPEGGCWKPMNKTRIDAAAADGSAKSL